MSSGTIRSQSIRDPDVRAREDVVAALRADPRTAGLGFDVGAEDGIITLTGTVESVAQRNAMVDVVLDVPGVSGINECLSVQLTSDTWRADADILYAAAGALAWDAEVPEKSIKAQVQDGWLWLVGEADWIFQRSAAERAVENLVGIKGVTNLIRVKDAPTR
jgi:osmotically-inducible protein OsmY